MPEISRFYGIIIRMFYNEHNPPHFHAEYGEFRIVMNLSDEVVNGFMPQRALRLIFEWTELHKNELLENWDICQNEDIPNRIAPLK